MNEFSAQNWQTALSKVYVSATHDPAYRQLCLTDPSEAVRRVSDIQLPSGFRFEFVDNAKKVVSSLILCSLLLPPLLTPVKLVGRDQTAGKTTKITDQRVADDPDPSPDPDPDSDPDSAPNEVHTPGPGGTHGGNVAFI